MIGFDECARGAFDGRGCLAFAWDWSEQPRRLVAGGFECELSDAALLAFREAEQLGRVLRIGLELEQQAGSVWLAGEREASLLDAAISVEGLAPGNGPRRL